MARYAAAGLAVETLAQAADADPGGRYDLARAACADLAGLPPASLPAPVAATLSRLRAALRAIPGQQN
ncbi:hypothetical protein [Plantactinospora siamensis]